MRLDPKCTVRIGFDLQIMRPRVLLPKRQVICQPAIQFQPFELRPQILDSVARDVPPVGVLPYWLAILAFHKDESGWERSPSRHAGPFNVPETDLAFATSDASDDAMVVSVIYT